MEGTSCGDECPFVKQGFCAKVNECPNHIESVWEDGKTNETKLIRDCAPKRMILQQQYMQNRLEGVQSALEQSRNEYRELSAYLRGLIEMSKVVIEKTMETKHEKNIHLLEHDSNAL